MRQHLLYIACPAQTHLTRQALERLGATPVDDPRSSNACFELRHHLLGKLVLQINVLSDLDGVTAHLRQNPVDLLIYDERGEGGIETIQAIERIREDVRKLAELWGPDFLFPMSRVVAILNQMSHEAARAFALGRLNLRDVCIAPRNTASILHWLKDVLSQGIIREDKVGMALSGGGIEGFLYQIGVLYALERAISGKKLNKDLGVISGVSSGAIAGAMFGCQIPVVEIIKALNRKSDILPSFTSSNIFDLAGSDILKRVVRESTAWAGLSPQKWLEKTLRSVPTGFFKGQSIETFFRNVLKAYDVEDKFTAQDVDLLIGATDQDSFEHIIFGQAPHRDVQISEAVRASCALPPLFQPKQINGRWYVDGQVTKTCNLEPLVDMGCRLIIIINPLKPRATNIAGTSDQEGGIFLLIQTIKALVSTRFEASLMHIAERYPDIDFLVLEPDEECAHLMAGSPMRYRIRTQLIQLAYTSTLRRLRERHHVYATKLGKYGFNLAPPDELKALEKGDGGVFADL